MDNMNNKLMNSFNSSDRLISHTTNAEFIFRPVYVLVTVHYYVPFPKFFQLRLY